MKNQLREFWSSDKSLSILLWVLGITIFVALPTLVLLGEKEWERIIGAIFFTAIVISGLATVWRRREARPMLALIAGVPLLVVWIEIAYHPPVMSLLTGGIRLLLVSLFATVLLAHVVAPGPITRARLKGAVAVYLLIGIIFAEAYRLLYIAFPGAVSVHTSNTMTVKFFQELVYFSLSTLTTAGYGDITPVHPLARSLANLEAVTGQLYIVLLIGRLLTLHLAQAEQRMEEVEAEVRTTEPRRPVQKG